MKNFLQRAKQFLVKEDGPTATEYAVMLALIIIGQLLTGLVLDSFGWLGVTPRPLEWTRAAGVLILLAGGYLVIR